MIELHFDKAMTMRDDLETCYRVYASIYRSSLDCSTRNA